VSKGQEKREVANRRLAAVAASVSEGLGDWRQSVVQDEARLDGDLLQLARGVLADAPGQSMSLSAAGTALQERVRRAGLRGDDGMILNTSRHVKLRYGGWEGFARSAPRTLSVVGETVRLVLALDTSGAMVTELPAVSRAARADVASSVVRESIPSALSSLGLGEEVEGIPSALSFL
jgi:hypothetical protein